MRANKTWVLILLGLATLTAWGRWGGGSFDSTGRSGDYWWWDNRQDPVKRQMKRGSASDFV